MRRTNPFEPVEPAPPLSYAIEVSTFQGLTLNPEPINYFYRPTCYMPATEYYYGNSTYQRSVEILRHQDCL